MNAPKAEVSLFDFTDYRSFLLQRGLPQGFYAHTAKNLKSWAQRLGYKSPSSLSMVLTGERFPSDEMINRFAEDFHFSPRETRFFKMLVEYEKALKNKEDASFLLKDIQQAAAESNAHAIDCSTFEIMCSWYFVAIKQLVGTPSFVEDYNWIKRRLRGRVSREQVAEALKVLLELEMIGLSLQALTEQSVEQRQFSATTIRMSKKNVTIAKKFVYDFMKEFSTRFYETEGDEVYQFNSNFFELTKDPHALSASEHEVR